MSIKEYIKELEVASSALIDSIWKEYEQVKGVDMQIKKLLQMSSKRYKQIRIRYSDVDNLINSEGSAWKSHLDEEFYVKKLRQQLDTHTYSVEALCSALLQIAKQGISLVYRGLHSCPNGRKIGRRYLKEIIWEGRNQTMHYEEGNCRSPIVNLFSDLAKDNAVFNKYNTYNLAFEIIKLLNWTSIDRYNKDLLTMK